MKRALVLSGGGARGAFQFGALKFIYENIMSASPEYKFDTIAGVSVGALNGAMLAQNKFDALTDIWNEINDSKVYTGRLTLLHALWRILTGKKSVLGNKPLHRLIQQNISLEDIPESCNFRFGAVSLVTGKYSFFQPGDFYNSTELRKAILSSSAIPVIWEPIKQIHLRGDRIVEDMVDGGLRNYSPLGDVLDTNPDEVVIINCSTDDLRDDPDASKNILTIANRALTEITLDEIFRNDVLDFLKINRLVKQASEQDATLKKRDGSPYKFYKARVIQPEKYPGDTLDFSQVTIQKRISDGYNRAKTVFQSADDF